MAVTVWKLLALALLMVEVHGQSCPPAPQLTGKDALSVVCASGSGVAARSPACSIWRLCQDTSTPRMYPSMCNTTRLAATLCLDDADVVAKISSCASYAAQKQTVLTAACKTQLGYFSIYSTSKTLQAAGKNCEAMGGAGSMAGCDLCPAPDSTCTDPLQALGQGCAEMTMAQCMVAPTVMDFCANDAAGPGGQAGYAAPHICFTPAQLSTMSIPQPSPTPSPTPSPVPSPRPSPVPSPVGSTLPSPVKASPPQMVIAPAPAPGTSPAPSSNTSAANACIADPTSANCSTYIYPVANITADIDSLCTAMSDMPGCSLQRLCQANSSLGNSSLECSPLIILASLCQDMPSMQGCRNFNSLCQNGTVVEQCGIAGTGVPGLPTTSQARAAIASLCATNASAACANCTVKPMVMSDPTTCPDPLGTLAALCTNASNAQQPGCSNFTALCSAAASIDSGSALGPLCGAAFVAASPSPASSPAAPGSSPTASPAPGSSPPLAAPLQAQCHQLGTLAMAVLGALMIMLLNVA